MSNAKLKVVLTAILLVFAVIPALIVGTVGMISVFSYESGAKTDTLKTVSLSKSAAVQQLFTGYSSNLSALAKTENVIKAAENGTNDANSLIKAFTQNGNDIIDTLIIDANGTVLASAAGSSSGSFEHFDSSNMPSVSGIMTWENYGRADAFFMSKEIYAEPDSKTGGKLGYVCAVISLAPDGGIVKALQGEFLDGGHMVLIDDSGSFVNFDGNGTVMKNGEVDSALGNRTLEMFTMTNSVSSGNSADTMYSSSAGKYSYSVGVIPNVTTWRWAGIVESGTFMSFSGLTNIIGWAVILIAAAIAAVIAMTIITNFVKHMHSMLDTMNEIAMSPEGAADIRFEARGGRSELGVIQGSFNELLDEMLLSEERHRTIAELSDNMLFEWDFHKERMYVSDNTLAKFNINTEGATLSNGRFIDSLMNSEDAERYKRDINQLLKNKNGYSAEYPMQTKSGAVIWVSVRASCVTDRLGEPLRVIGVLTDIDNEKKMELQLSERASYDFLSQLYNRSTFIRNLTAEIERRGANKIAVLFIDVDDFKFINDRYGHAIGDEVIKFVADTIRLKVDDRGGFAGRFGGDEFVLCVTNQDDIANIENISWDIIQELSVGHTSEDGTTVNVRASIGVAYCPEHSENVTELLSFADTAMYYVKKNGKTNYHIYVPEDSATDEYIDPEGF